jgi:hypothetical protein
MKCLCFLCYICICICHVMKIGGIGQIRSRLSFEPQHVCWLLPSLERNSKIMLRTRMSKPFGKTARSTKLSPYSSISNSFRTEISVGKLVHPPIQQNDTICLMGSCFAENIGDILTDFKFQCNVNPFGIIYHPVPLSQSLRNMLQMKNFSTSDLRFDGEKWFSYAHHSSFSRRDPHHSLQLMNDSSCRGLQLLSKARVLFLTLGTAWAHRLHENGMVGLMFQEIQRCTKIDIISSNCELSRWLQIAINSRSICLKKSAFPLKKWSSN